MFHWGGGGGSLYNIALQLKDPCCSRFNPYDRAPLNTVPPTDIAQFYCSYTALQGIIRRQESEFWIKLKPGMVLLVDNWRVMHGRSGFTGKRVICGCYLPRDDWMSRIRALGLLWMQTVFSIKHEWGQILTKCAFCGLVWICWKYFLCFDWLESTMEACFLCSDWLGTVGNMFCILVG